MNSVTDFLRRLLPLLLVLPLLTGCDDDDDYYGPPPPPGADFSELWASSVLAPTLCPYYIYPNDSSSDAKWYDNYDDTYTILNSGRDVRYYFTNDQLRDYPALLNVDFSRYSVVIYTAYNRFEVNSFGFQWGYDPYDSRYSYELYLTFYPLGDRLRPGELALSQGAIIVDKISSDADIHIYPDYYDR